MLGEPPPSPGDLHFSLFGLPVRIHPIFWLVSAIMGLPRGRPDMREAVVQLATWMVAVFIAILVHEVGHALAMRYYGYTPYVVLYGFGGLTSYGGASYRLRASGWQAQVLISFAGPAAGFLLGGAILAVIAATGRAVQFGLGGPYGFWFDYEAIGNPMLEMLIGYILFISIVWGMVNLLPVYPLDGGQISRELFQRFARDGLRQSIILSIVAGVGMAAVGMLVWQSLFVTIFFALLAFQSYQILQAYGGRW